MKMLDIVKMEVPELYDLLKRYKQEAMNLRFQKAMKELVNTSRIKQVRNVIARVNTALLMKQKKQ